jgi:hypothetical protein
MLLSEAICRVRDEIGDPLQPFMTNSLGDGMTMLYDLPKQNLDPSTITVTIINGAETSVLNLNSDYTLDTELGYVQLASPVPNNANLIVAGRAWAMFTDDELITYINDSVRQHCYNQIIEERYRDKRGFITYRETPKNLNNLPAIEEPLIVMLATYNVLWVLANDAATDANIQTAEGTNIDRVSRYQQLMGHIMALEERYQRYCGLLNVGAFRMETLKLRRVSRTTGRLVPLFKEREYDDHSYPVRELPPVDRHYEDGSGIPSPLWNAQGY